ncbi:MAG: transglycosylase domain-containing protein [Candidatus Dormibacteria bacterium]
MTLLAILTALLVFPTTTLALAATAGAGQSLGGLPSIDNLSAASLLQQDTLIYDRNGKLLADLGSQGDHRVIVPLNRISPSLVNATIAIEDHSFYDNAGVDFQGIVRAALADYQHRTVTQGASTITQQLAKLLFLTSKSGIADRTLQRKATEAALALEITRRYTKDQIMEMYLNTIFYGNQAYGAQAAAKSFFGVDAKDLDLAQASMLAGLPQEPSGLNPNRHPDLAIARQTEVLQSMVDLRMITAQQMRAALDEPLKLHQPLNQYLAPRFVEYVLDDLERNFGLSGNKLSGLSIQTSLDLDRNNIATQVIDDQISQLSYQHVTDAALVSMDPRTGEILTMIGSADDTSDTGQINMAVTPRSPGSSFKIFTYTAAIESRRFTMETSIQDAPMSLPKGGGTDGESAYAPQNYDHRFHGTVPLRLALGNSLNIPAIKVELTVGIPAVLATARAMGVTSLTEDDSSYGASLTLGAYPIRLLELADGASTLADMGTHHDPVSVLRITDATGNAVYRYDETKNRDEAVSPATAYIMSDILSDDRNRCMEFGCGSDLTLDGHQVAAKTGTTDTFKDNLTVGYTPQVVTAVWVGNADDSPMYNSTGITGAAPIWHRFMQQILAGVPDNWYDMPPGVVQHGSDYFLEGAEFAQPADHFYVPETTPTPAPAPGSAPSHSEAPPGWVITPAPGPAASRAPSP